MKDIELCPLFLHFRNGSRLALESESARGFHAQVWPLVESYPRSVRLMSDQKPRDIPTLLGEHANTKLVPPVFPVEPEALVVLLVLSVQVQEVMLLLLLYR